MREHGSPYYLWQLLRTVRNFPLYFLNRCSLLRRPAITYHLRSGLSITARPFAIDRCAINEVWFDRVYDPPGFDWQSAHVILDIGANIGAFTLFAARCAPHGHIYAFEPDPDTATVLRENVARNNLSDRITVEACGVASHSGTRTFYRTPQTSLFSSLYQRGEHDVPIPVPVLSLPEIFRRFGISECDLLKLDCEGAEYEILYSLTPADFSHIGFIALEHHSFLSDPRCTPTALRTFLESHGYRVTERANNIFYVQRARRSVSLASSTHVKD